MNISVDCSKAVTNRIIQYPTSHAMTGTVRRNQREIQLWVLTAISILGKKSEFGPGRLTDLWKPNGRASKHLISETCNMDTVPHIRNDPGNRCLYYDRDYSENFERQMRATEW